MVCCGRINSNIALSVLFLKEQTYQSIMLLEDITLKRGYRKYQPLMYKIMVKKYD